jgi:cell division protein FtsI (penicillin-binding protein 3)
LVPNVVGLSAKDATYLLESSGLIVHLSGYGVVNSQSVYAGKEAIKGESIELILKK